MSSPTTPDSLAEAIRRAQDDLMKVLFHLTALPTTEGPMGKQGVIDKGASVGVSATTQNNAPTARTDLASGLLAEYQRQAAQPQPAPVGMVSEGALREYKDTLIRMCWRHGTSDSEDSRAALFAITPRLALEAGYFHPDAVDDEIRRRCLHTGIPSMVCVLTGPRWAKGKA